MECITCRRDDVFNRVVVNQLADRELGLFCADCESTTFGGLLDRPEWHQAHGCAFCDGAGRYALPTLECLVQSDGASPQLEYAAGEETVALCRDHLEELLHPETRIGSPVEA